MDPFGDHLFEAFNRSGNAKKNFLKDGEFHFDKTVPALKPDDNEDGELVDVSQVPEPIKDSLLLKVAQEDEEMYENIPKIKVHSVFTGDTCLHEVAIPPDGEYVPLRRYDRPPIRKYDFDLDPFQKQAILCLDNNESVLVSAHTSAGKTVVAEYAIAMALADKQRVIYTTPIKALSNQKYRELFEVFGDVGLMTGDVTINPDASCLIMTTEILRSMLYRGAEITREVAWVIFDEIHYMRDKERGVIWEETIILLNDTVHYVFLSATIPNARQFAEWIAFLHKQACHVVYTEERPVPLHHYVFPAGGVGLHLVVDEDGVFKDENFGQAMALLREGADSAIAEDRKGTMDGQTSCAKLLKLIHDRRLTPCIIFNFSRRECEAYASEIYNKLDFNDGTEKKMVDEVFGNAIGILSDEDQQLPQVKSLLPLLRRGIGIHHSGILPILKETIEILFAEGLLKALFATETFAMGLNMPARTVLFTAARKFDGKELRWINSGEYIQMSGRAGRRGIDDRGISILVIDERMSPATAKNIIRGQPMGLNSAFKLTYNMVLNLMRVEGIDPEFMLERSFHQFQNYATVPILQKTLEAKTQQYANFKLPLEEEIASYYKVRQQLNSLGRQMSKFFQTREVVDKYLHAGRLVIIRSDEYDFGWCVIVGHKKKAVTALSTTSDETAEEKKNVKIEYTLDVLASITTDSANQAFSSQIKPAPLATGELHVIPVDLSLLHKISAVRLYVPDEIGSVEARTAMKKTLMEVHQRFPGGIPLLDPIQDMNLRDGDLNDVIIKIEAFEDRLFAHKINDHLKPDEIEDLFRKYDQKAKMEIEMKEARQKLKDARSLLMIEELRKRKRVLRRLGYCDQSDVVQLKGRVACEIDTSEELILTELLFEGVFNDLSVSQTAALLSCFVFQERHSELPRLSPELAAPLRAMQQVARRVAKVTSECKMDINIETFVESFKPYLMDVVRAWAEGKPFWSIVKMTTVFEGSIIRCIRRLEELLRQMSSAAKSIESDELEEKFLEAATRIKRDIIFAASLYL